MIRAYETGLLATLPAKKWWKRLDSNQRAVTNGFTVRHLRPLGHTSINLVPQEGIEPPHPAYKAGPLPLRIQGHIIWRHRWDSNPPDTDRQSAALPEDYYGLFFNVAPGRHPQVRLRNREKSVRTLYSL